MICGFFAPRAASPSPPAWIWFVNSAARSSAEFIFSLSLFYQLRLSSVFQPECRLSLRESDRWPLTNTAVMMRWYQGITSDITAIVRLLLVVFSVCAALLPLFSLICSRFSRLKLHEAVGESEVSDVWTLDTSWSNQTCYKVVKTPFTCLVVFTTAYMFFLHVQWWNEKLRMFTLQTWELQIQKHNLWKSFWCLIHPDSRLQTCPKIQHRWTSHRCEGWKVTLCSSWTFFHFPGVNLEHTYLPGLDCWGVDRRFVPWVKFCVHVWRLTPRTLWSWKTKDSTQIYFNLWKMKLVGDLLIFNWMCRFNRPCSFMWVINKTCSWPVTFL